LKWREAAERKRQKLHGPNEISAMVPLPTRELWGGVPAPFNFPIRPLPATSNQIFYGTKLTPRPLPIFRVHNRANLGTKAEEIDENGKMCNCDPNGNPP